MGDITDEDYLRAKRVVVKVEDLGEYHDLYVWSNTLLPAGVFENFWNMCLEIYEHDSARFLTAPGLVCQEALKKTKTINKYMKDYDESKE